jgi:hypothetical protein
MKKHTPTLLATIGLLVAGCSSTSTPSSSSTSASPSPTVTAPAPSSTTEPAVTSVAGGEALEPEPAGEAIPVVVEGTPLPSAVTSTYLDSGGQLLVTGPMWEQLGVRSMPYPSAPGAYLTDIESIVEMVEPGVVARNEGFGWLFEDPRTLGELLDEFATSVEITDGGWVRTDTEKVESGANCVERTFTHPASTVAWTLSGCSYPQFSGMRALQVRRQGRYSTTGLQPPTMLAGQQEVTGPVTAAVTAELAGWSVIVTAPDSSGQTLFTSTRYTTATTVETSIDTVLAGWTKTPSTADAGVVWRSGNDRFELDGTSLRFYRVGRVDQ